MRFYLAGDSPRDRALASLLKAGGHTVAAQPPWDVAVLSLPRSSLPDEEFPPGQKILCGIMTDEEKARALERGWTLLPILDDEGFTQENAWLTAEGALHAVMGQTGKALCDMNSLVIGYGRIGKGVTHLLRAFASPVTVAARRKESREMAGKNSIPMEGIPDFLAHVDLIVNTVPFPLLTKELLSFVPKHAPLLELASPPYGIDIDAARALGLTVMVESGLPGRYCPYSAARAMLRYIEQEAMSHE